MNIPRLSYYWATLLGVALFAAPALPQSAPAEKGSRPAPPPKKAAGERPPAGPPDSKSGQGPKAWPRGAWDAADHNRDGNVTREEMRKFGSQEPHRNGPRLLWHFDSADKNRDGVVDRKEADAYGYNIGSKDPNDHLPPPKTNRPPQRP